MARSLAVFLAVSLAACGSLAPPISISESDPSTTAPTPPFVLEAVEGQPRGLMLRLTAEMDLDPDGTIVVERRIADGDVERIRTIELSSTRIDQIAAGKLQFLDRSVVPDAPHHYRLVYRPPSPDGSTKPAPDRTSPPLTLTWREPPPRPDHLEAERLDQAVELRWRPTGRGAVIFRRDVLADDSRLERIATVGPGARGHLVDRSVRPGGVYAYQVSLATSDSPYPQFGPPSDPLYVSLSDGN